MIPFFPELCYAVPYHLHRSAQDEEESLRQRAVFEKYSQMDRSRLGLAGAGEWESLEPLLPDFAGKRVLDLGCGYGWHCIYAGGTTARASVTGVDLSEKMLAVAREKTTAPQVTYIRGDMAETPFPPESFDVVLSSLAIHYLPSFTDFLERVRQCLSPGGDFVFSVEHPIFTAAGPQEWYYGPDGTPLHFPVDRYFEEGRRTARFLGEDVTKYHRTLTTYLDTLLRRGFRLLRVVEPQPSEELLRQVPDMKEELRRPMMLIVLAQKDA